MQSEIMGGQDVEDNHKIYVVEYPNDTVQRFRVHKDSDMYLCVERDIVRDKPTLDVRGLFYGLVGVSADAKIPTEFAYMVLHVDQKYRFRYVNSKPMYDDMGEALEECCIAIIKREIEAKYDPEVSVVKIDKFYRNLKSVD